MWYSKNGVIFLCGIPKMADFLCGIPEMVHRSTEKASNVCVQRY